MGSPSTDAPATPKALVLPTVPIRYLYEIVRSSRVTPAQLSEALAAAGLAEDTLPLPNMRASVVQFGKVYTMFRRWTGDELVGFLARPVPSGTYHTLLERLTDCADMQAVHRATVAFYKLFDRHRYWHLDVDGSRAQIRLETRTESQASSIFFLHAMLLPPLRTASWLAGRDQPLIELRLPRRFRSFASESRFLFGIEPTFVDGPAATVFASEDLRRPVVRSAEEARAYAGPALLRLLFVPRTAPLEHQLRRLLSGADPFAGLSIEQAARLLGQSRATLARRLADEQLSFQRIKDELRRDLAIELLTSTHDSVAAIAERLGFSAPSAFLRAFRAWTGSSPGAARRGAATD